MRRIPFSVSNTSREFLLSTAEAVLRQETIATEETKNAISIAYRLGGIETYRSSYCIVWMAVFLLSTAEAVLRRGEFCFIFLCIGKFLLSTAEAVLRQETIATEETKNAISVAYRLGGIEAPY